MVRKILSGVVFAGIVANLYAAPVPPTSISSVSGLTQLDVNCGKAYILPGIDGSQTGDESRYHPETMFDGVIAEDNFYAMGFDGVVQIDLDVPAHFTNDAVFIEVTWDNGGEIDHHEAAEVWWGKDDGTGGIAFVEGGLLSNSVDFGIIDDSYASWEKIVAETNSNDIMVWRAYVPTDDIYSSLLIRDVTQSAFTVETKSYDGFDIGEINYSVPEPASITFLGLGMLSIFGLALRRRK